MTARGDMTEAFARAMAAPRRRPKTLLGGRASVNPDTMLGDRLAVVLAEEGCLTCATLARKVRRRNATVLAVLSTDARFTASGGRTKGRRWCPSEGIGTNPGVHPDGYLP